MQFAVSTQFLLLVTCPMCWAMSNQYYEGVTDGMGLCKICTFIRITSSDMESFACSKFTEKPGAWVFALVGKPIPDEALSATILSCVGYRPQPAARSLGDVYFSCVHVSTCLNMTLSLGLMSGRRLFSLLHLF